MPLLGRQWWTMRLTPYAPDAHISGAAFDLVAVAVSLGGIDALCQVLSVLRREFPSAIVVVQRLHPQHPSKSGDILRQRTPLTVTWVDKGDRFSPCIVMIAPKEMHMISLEAIEPERMAFLYELYTRSAGDAAQGIPYEELIDALGFGEALTKRIQRALQLEGWVELTTVPPVTHMGRPVAGHTHRHSRQQTIGMTPQGVRLMEDLIATLNTAPPPCSAPPDPTTTI
jgi:hypothetical protein